MTDEGSENDRRCHRHWLAVCRCHAVAGCLVKLVQPVVPRSAVVVVELGRVSPPVTRRLYTWRQLWGGCAWVVAADGGEASSRCCRRLELQHFGSDADDTTTRVGCQRCPADDRHADDQLCRNTVAVPSFRRRAVIVCHVRTGVVPSCTSVMDVICYSSNITHSSVFTTRRRKLGNLECHELCTGKTGVLLTSFLGLGQCLSVSIRHSFSFQLDINTN